MSNQIDELEDIIYYGASAWNVPQGCTEQEVRSAMSSVIPNYQSMTLTSDIDDATGVTTWRFVESGGTKG